MTCSVKYNARYVFTDGEFVGLSVGSFCRGLVLFSTSSPSNKPSPSVSLFKGLVPRAFSVPSLKPSPSVSLFVELVPRAFSLPSLKPSMSESMQNGS